MASRNKAARSEVEDMLAAAKALTRPPTSKPATGKTLRYDLAAFLRAGKIAIKKRDEVARVLDESTWTLKSSHQMFTDEANELMGQKGSTLGKDFLRIVSGWLKPHVTEHYGNDEKRSLVITGLWNNKVVGALLAHRMERSEIAKLNTEVLVGEMREAARLKGVDASTDQRMVETEVKNVPTDRAPEATPEQYEYRLLMWGVRWDIAAEMSRAEEKALSELAHEAPFWMVRVMGVLPEFHRRNVARKMIEEVKAQATKDKVPVFVIADYEAVGFYSKCGFKTAEG
ncbi:Uu.00g127290.m01.CDS01 [Anthostomella pinea]|uniref:Uu.00g127290.m01.CDS01 n=1 Tax=Anthostomella pinea TaxID=933095 RepID=A0AAI8VJ15_9PEZI|nr:Uu.00g127290.m01.CDS01 [Anthostomella pinea]